MTPLLPTFRPTGSPLHRARTGVAVSYLGAAGAVAIVFDHPLLLGAALAGVIAAAAVAGVGRELARGARFALPLALLVAAVNPLVSRQGLTLLVQGPVVPVLGKLDITLEALVYGCIAGLRVLVLALVFSLYSAAVDPDEVLKAFRRLSLRSSLTASLATRLLPVVAHDAARLADAYALRATARASEGRAERTRRAAVLTRALAAGAFERSVEVAAALEVRGYANTSRAEPRARLPWSLYDRAFAASALSIACAISIAAVFGLASFDPYPTVHADLGLADIGLALAIPVAMLAPFVRGRRTRG